MTHPLMPGVTPDSYWPYDRMPQQKYTTGPWKIGMSAGGSMVLWPTDQPFPLDLGLIPVCQGEKEDLEEFFVAFCRLGYEKDARHVHQDGDTYLFNWRSFTLAQIGIASQVAHAHLRGDRKTALAIGRAFQDQIEAAQRTAGDRYGV